jgi:putative addiction module component (TIGR02574 family)
MSAAKDRILQDALNLDQRERADLAARLIESLEPANPSDQDSIERAWAEEIERRCADVDAGRSSTQLWSEVRVALETEILKR